MQGRRQKGLVFLIALPVMFAIGLALKGALFRASIFSDPLVGLAAIANLGMGIPYFIAKALSLGKGVVTAASYEYGNTFLIVVGTAQHARRDRRLRRAARAEVMTSHFGLMIAVRVLRLADLRDDRERHAGRTGSSLGARMFAMFIAAAIVLGWVMRIFPL